MKKRISYNTNQSIKSELNEHLVAGNYNLKMKSKWICESIEQLLEMKNYPELVDLNDEMTNFTEKDTVSLDLRLKYKIDDAIIKIRKLYPSMEGVQSRIIRTAILQRILRA